MTPTGAPIETDQVDCYGEDGQRVSCPGSGQDGSWAKRASLPPQHRFTVTGALVRDALTGARWSRDANPAGFPRTWREACDVVADMRRTGVHGQSDWQLPPRRLLFSLISHQRVNPALPADHPFDNVFPGYYWSADSCRRLADQAWYVHLGGGRVHRGMKHGSYLVWPVCTPTTRPMVDDGGSGHRFRLDGGGVHDAVSGRIWSRNADPLGRSLSWRQALSAVDELNRTAWHGRTDWRMPTVRELESLVDLDAHSPALPAGHPFTDVLETYWSSTTSVYEPRYAWALYSRDGILGVGFKAGADFHLWPVRG